MTRQSEPASPDRSRAPSCELSGSALMRSPVRPPTLADSTAANPAHAIGGFATASEVIVGGMAWAFVITYVAVAIARLTYPFDLDWMEGGSVDHVRRILTGQPIYVAPTLA